MKAIESKTEKVVFARFFEGEDLIETVAETAKQNDVDSGFFFLIGTLKSAVLGYYENGKYLPVEKAGPLEIVSCTGNVSTKEEGELVVHGHVVVSDRDAKAFGGHVLPGCLVDATVELVLVKIEDGILRREFDARRNLYLLSLGERATGDLSSS
ncbi:MAG: PPC domain-containing DNA-binding protein [Candidatus Bathyarchaeia archaeon]